MGRKAGSKNLIAPRPPHTVELTTDEKIEFLAALMIDRISADMANGQELLKRIEGEYATKLPTSP